MSNPKEFPYNITEWQMHLLSDIFRIIVREIKSDEDKALLAPGELGISYAEGCFYIRNPYTGELFSPNSIEHIRQILEKYDPKTRLLNADRVCNIRFYSSISQLHQLGISMSPDTVIRQMEYPAVLYAPAEYKESYETLGYPSGSGMLTVVKLSPEFVTARYYDNLTYSYYDGRYNSLKNFFEGWNLSGSLETEYLESIGGGDTTKVKSNRPLEDLMIIAVRITEELNPGAKLAYNDGPFQPILMADRKPLDHPIAPDNIIMLIYDKAKGCWVMTDPTESSTATIISIQQERINAQQESIEALNTTIEYMKKDYIERVAELRADTERQITALKARPGLIVPVSSTYVAAQDAVDTVAKVANYDPRVDYLVVNLHQTILRPGIDYVIDVDDTGKCAGLIFPNIRLSIGDTLQFIVLKQPVDQQEKLAKSVKKKGV